MFCKSATAVRYEGIGLSIQVVLQVRELCVYPTTRMHGPATARMPFSRQKRMASSDSAPGCIQA